MNQNLKTQAPGITRSSKVTSRPSTQIPWRKAAVATATKAEKAEVYMDVGEAMGLAMVELLKQVK